MKKLISAFLVLILWPTLALAQIAGSYPYTFTNGTLADANQVMSNFNYISNAVNTGACALTGCTLTGPLIGTTGSFSGAVSSSGFTGPLTGNVTGNVTGSISGGAISGSTGTFSGALTGTTANFSGNVTDNGVLNAAGSLVVQGNYFPGLSALEITNSCAGLGAAYGACWFLSNGASGASNPNKYIRINPTGGLEIVNSAQSAVIFTLTDAGGLGVSGGISTSTGSFTSTVTAPTFSGSLNGNATTATSATSAGSASTATFAGTASVANSVAAGSVGSAGLASGAAVGNIGYTPVNKAGDTMTGNLTVPTVIGALSGNATTASTASTCATGCTTQGSPVAFIGASASGAGSISYGTAAPGTLAVGAIYLQTN